MSRILIYGATGYTGSLVARQAKTAGLDFAIAGRNTTKLAALARELDVPYSAFPLDVGHLAKSLAGVSVLLNCAGPFAKTAEPLIRACIEAGSHYLDITAEINVYRLAARLGADASRAGVMLLPGVLGRGADRLPGTAAFTTGRAARLAAGRPPSCRLHVAWIGH